MTVPNQDFLPPTFGIQFTKKPPLVKQTSVITTMASNAPTVTTTTSTATIPINTPIPPPAPQFQAPASLVKSTPHHNPNNPLYTTTESFMQRYGSHHRGGVNSPGTQRSVRTARPGSVFIPRRSPIEPDLLDPSTAKSGNSNSATNSTTPTTTTTTTRVRFASPAAHARDISPVGECKNIILFIYYKDG